MSLLKVTGVSMREEGRSVLENVSFKQQSQQKIAIAGETGAGKSTLLKIIAGLVQPSAGEIFFDGEQVIGPVEKLIPGHAGIAYLSQHFELPKSLRVEQVLKYANTLPESEAETLYEVCRITHLLKRRTDQLSGGEKQRIALAKLLISWPGLLLLDEPFSNLDAVHRKILKSIIRDIGEQLQITCILTSHDPLDTLSWADEIIVLKEGQIVQQGTPKQIYRQPADEYTAALFGSYNLLSPEEATAFTQLPGVEANGRSLLIRPESFILVGSEQTDSLAGKVHRINFFGGYSEAEVETAGGVIVVRAGSADLKAGEAVHVSLAPDCAWYMQPQ